MVNTQRQGITSADRLYPGQLMFLNHFHTPAQGYKNSGHGISVNSKVGGRSYGGRCIAVCGATGYIMVECQTSFSTASTVEAIKEFEQHALDHRVVIKSYQSDNGSAFTSKLFKQRLLDTNKDSRFSAAGSHHQNGKAERAIRTIMAMARTMMLHAALHWDEASNPTWWPQAVRHAVFIYYRIPKVDKDVQPGD